MSPVPFAARRGTDGGDAALAEKHASGEGRSGSLPGADRIGVAAALVIAVGWLAGEVLKGDTAAFDRTILLWFRVTGDPSRLVGPNWLAETLRDVTSLGSTVVLWTLVAVAAAYLWLAWRRADFLLLLGIVTFGQAVSTISKMSFARARPDLVPGAPQVFTASFPSGHALLSAVVYLTLGALLARAESRPVIKRFYIAVAVFRRHRN